MNRIMFDSVNLYGIPKIGGQLVAFYLDGIYAVASIAEVEAMFPKWQHVPIDVMGNRPDYARVFDVESGDIKPEDTERIITDYKRESPWYKTGGRPIIYCNRSTIPDVRLGTGKYLLGHDYFLWVAAPNSLYSGFGVVACQNVWSRTFNSSVVFSDQWMPSK